MAVNIVVWTQLWQYEVTNKTTLSALQIDDKYKGFVNITFEALILFYLIVQANSGTNVFNIYLTYLSQ